MKPKKAATVSHNQKTLATLYTGSQMTLLTEGTEVPGDIVIEVFPGLDIASMSWTGDCKVEDIK